MKPEEVTRVDENFKAIGIILVTLIICPTYFIITSLSQSELYMMEDSLPKPKENVYVL